MNDFPEITTDQIVTRLRMIVAEPDSLCKTDFHYIEDAADEIELLRSTVTDRNIEIERLRKERDEARGRLCDIVVLVEAEQDQRISKKHGHDISMLTAVKVVTTFVMTPEFVDDLYGVNKQYEQVGSMVAQTLKNVVDQKKGIDIRSIAIVRPMVARSHA